jgi:diguanylate cyclase (GGDEF)-like protein
VRRAGSLRRVLLVEPDAALAARSVEAFRGAALDATLAADAETGLRTLAASEPDVLMLELTLPGRDGAWLLRRLRDDFMGARPRVVVTTVPDAFDGSRQGGVTELGVDAVVLKPATPTALLAAAEMKIEDGAREVERLRELCKLSILAGDLQAALDGLAKKLALLYRTSECVVVGIAGDRQGIGAARGPVDESPADPIWERSRAALDTGATVLASDGSQVTSYLAVPIQAPGASRLGVIILADDQPRLYPPEALDGLRALGQRLAAELAWRSVHERIAADRDRLRESSMLDPMLSIWTRAALDQALPGEVSACQRRGEPMTLAILDLKGLRHINERYGHLVGDSALRYLAAQVRQSLRSQDMVARYTGDTLSVALPGAPILEARRVVERLQSTLSARPMVHEEQRIPVEVFAGLAALGDDDSGEAALGRAAAAVRAGKRRRDPLVVADASISGDPEGVAAIAEGMEHGVTLGGMYQILHEISRGAMGVVYRAEDLGLGRPVALKTLRPDLARDKNFVERFRTEAATLAAIRHENLVQVYAFGTDGEDVYFVMELVEGEPLEDRIELARHDGRFMPLGEALRVLGQIAGAVEAMHRAGVLHRDVKPPNILHDRARERAVLVDVGIAKRRGTDTDPAGTPGFTAPESFIGGLEGTATDVYGLAATAYVLLTAQQPFGEGPTEEVIGRQQHHRVLAPSSWRPGIPPAADEVLIGALHPEPPMRPQSASQFMEALELALSGASEELRAGIDLMPRSGDGDLGTAVTGESPRPRRAGVLSAVGSGSDEEAQTDPPRVAVAGPAVAAVLAAMPAPMPAGHVAATGPQALVPGARVSGGHPSVTAPYAVPGRAPTNPRIASVREPDPSGMATAPHTRGVLFRSATRILGARHGAIWVGQMARENPALGQALQPQSTLLSWHPTPVFVAMLHAVSSAGREPRQFARDLGRVATAATFSRFFGADPTVLTPWEVLGAADMIWRRYHTWGVVIVDRAADHEAQISIAGSPADPLVCASTGGILEQVARQSGANDYAVDEVACESQGAPTCTFRVRWSPPGE